jgi:nitrate reductase gamma subunit
LIYRALADLVLVVHLTFVLFVVLGGLLVLRWPWVAFLHIPTAIWGVLIEYSGWICPLTPLENSFRARGGEAGYSGGFIQHYIQPLLYPAGLTRGTQIVLGSLALILNLAAYGILVSRMRSRDPG